MGLNYYGRRAIYTNATEITRDNVVQELTDAMAVHARNREDIIWLQDYEKGDQPILERTKEVRPDICSRIVENHAASIVSFKVGYLFGSPVSLVQRADKDSSGEPADVDDIRVSLLNEMMSEQCKASKDQKLAHDFCTCGVGYRMVLPKRNKKPWEVSLFDILPLSPARTFVVRRNDVYEDVIMGVTYSVNKDPYSDGDFIQRFGVYTPTRYFEIEGQTIKKEEENPLGMVPIIEYIYDDDRMGAFEKVIPLLNSMNLTASERQDALEQFVQSILVIVNSDMCPEELENLPPNATLLLNSSSDGRQADAKLLVTTLDQTSTQSYVEHTLEQLEKIAAVPGKTANAQNTTGEAIQLSDGWQLAETAAKSEEHIFRDSEQKLLECILAIFRLDAGADRSLKTLRLSDVEIKFTRNRTDGLLVKVQALQLLLAAGIKNKHAFEACGLWSDTQTVWDDSKDTILGGTTDDASLDRLGTEPAASPEGGDEPSEGSAEE